MFTFYLQLIYIRLILFCLLIESSASSIGTGFVEEVQNMIKTTFKSENESGDKREPVAADTSEYRKKGTNSFF